MPSSPRFWDLSTLPKLTVDSGLAGNCLAEEFRVCIGVWVRNCLPQAQTLSYPSFDFIQPTCFLAPRLVLHPPAFAVSSAFLAFISPWPEG